MYSNGSFGILGNLDEPLQYLITRGAAITEEQVIVVEAGILEPPRIVDLLVKAHDACDVVLAEVGEVGFRGMEGVTYVEGEKWMTN